MAGLRVSGLASGMDIDGIVSELMTAERMPLNKIEQKKTYTEWQRDDYRTMNTALTEFRDSLAVDKGGVGSQSAFIKKTVAVSNNNVLSVENVNSTNNFSGTINKVTQLATPATMVSKEKNEAITNLQQKLSEIDENLVGQTITTKAINKDGGFDKKKDEDGKPTDVDDVFSYTIQADDTLEDVINKINADSGVTVFFDEGSKKFSITANNTGVPEDENGNLKAAIQLGGAVEGAPLSSEDESFFKKVMKLTELTSGVTTEGKATNLDSGGSSGQNAKLTYNGLEIERPSNTFTINGAKLTVKETTDTAVTYSSTPDVDAIYDKIKEFVDTYNGLIANISEKIDQKKNKSYDPLTKEQKEALSEDEIEKWEKLAREGTLYRDSNLSSLLTKMRASIYTSVKGTSFDNMDKIGIATTSAYLEGGKLAINEKELRAAIEEDPNGIYELFMGGSSDSPTEEQGIVRRLRSDLYTAIEDVSKKAGKTNSVNNTFTLGRLLDQYEDQISSFERKLADMESRYYRQFTAMEKAISQANSQSGMLMSYFTS